MKSAPVTTERVRTRKAPAEQAMKRNTTSTSPPHVMLTVVADAADLVAGKMKNNVEL